MSGRPAVFLDRDGTLNVERPEPVREPAELELLPGVGPALRALHAAGHALVVVTNQSAVARGTLTLARLERVHAALHARLAAQGAPLDAIYFCPHLPPDPGEPTTPLRRPCRCRKPAPALLERASADLHLDLSRSWLIGDATRDLASAAALQIPTILLLTGKGPGERPRAEAAPSPPDKICTDLPTAAREILGGS